MTAGHLLREAVASGRRPQQLWPSRAKGKDLKALEKRNHRVAIRLEKLCQQLPGQLIGADGRHQVAGQAPVVDAMGEKLFKVPQPAPDRGAPYPAKALEPLYGSVRILSLPKSADQQHHRRPVDPALPKPQRWRQYPAPATRRTAAQAEADLISLAKIRGPTARLSLVVGTVQRPPAIGQPRARVCSHRSWSIS
jgi:hypothetical protein